MVSSVHVDDESQNLSACNRYLVAVRCVPSICSTVSNIQRVTPRLSLTSPCTLPTFIRDFVCGDEGKKVEVHLPFFYPFLSSPPTLYLFFISLYWERDRGALV